MKMKWTLKKMWKKEKVKMCKLKISKLKKWETNNDKKIAKITYSKLILERA
jgi:hypothetical protein